MYFWKKLLLPKYWNSCQIYFKWLYFCILKVLWYSIITSRILKQWTKLWLPELLASITLFNLYSIYIQNKLKQKFIHLYFAFIHKQYMNIGITYFPSTLHAFALLVERWTSLHASSWLEYENRFFFSKISNTFCLLRYEATPLLVVRMEQNQSPLLPDL